MKRAIGVLMTARWASSGNGFFRSLTLDQPASDLTDFPVLFSGTYTYLKTVANGGKVQNSNGYDIVFYSDSALTTKLKFERVFWSASTGEVEFWVKIPTLTSATATVIYLAYGNPSITTDQQDQNNTWETNYKAVYHLQDGTTLTVADSTSNGNNSTTNGASANAGKIDGAMKRTGIVAVPVNINTIGQPFTFSAWVNPPDTSGFRAIWGGNAAGGFEIRINNTSNTISILHENQSAQFTTTGSVSASAWSYVVCTIDGSNNVSIYINNAAAETGTKDGTAFASGTSFIGVFETTNEAFTNGLIDEVRIASGVKTSTWVATEYSNQNDPANFYVIGSETPA